MRWLTQILIAVAIVTAAGREPRAAEPIAACLQYATEVLQSERVYPLTPARAR